MLQQAFRETGVRWFKIYDW